MYLLTLETVNIVSETICCFHDLSSQVDLDLAASQLFLLDPAIDGSELSLQALLQAHDSFILPLKLCFDDRVHGLVAIPHLISLVLRLLLIYLFFHINLILHLINLSEAFLLLLKEAIDQIGYSELQFGSKVLLDGTNCVLELLVVSEI